MCASLRVLYLTDWCASSRHDNHRTGVHFVAGLFETVDGGDPERLELSPPRMPTSTLDTGQLTRTVDSLTTNEPF